MKVEEVRRLQRRQQEVDGAQHDGGCGAARFPARQPVDWYGAQCQAKRLDHEQDTHIIPQPVERTEQDQDGLKVCREEVVAKGGLGGIAQELAMRTGPDGLVIYAEVEDGG